MTKQTTNSKSPLILSAKKTSVAPSFFANLSFLSEDLTKVFEELNSISKHYLGIFRNPFNIPTYRVFSETGSEGFGCNLDGGIALTRALLESMGGRLKKEVKTNTTLDSFQVPNYSSGSAVQDLERIDQIMIKNNFIFLMIQNGLCIVSFVVRQLI